MHSPESSRELDRCRRLNKFALSQYLRPCYSQTSATYDNRTDSFSARKPLHQNSPIMERYLAWESPTALCLNAFRVVLKWIRPRFSHTRNKNSTNPLTCDHLVTYYSPR